MTRRPPTVDNDTISSIKYQLTDRHFSDVIGHGIQYPMPYPLDPRPSLPYTRAAVRDMGR